MPGFVDLQVNGIGDLDVASADGGDWEVLGSVLLDQGVTAWCPTLVSAPLDSYEPALDRIAAAACRSAILGAHLEGPFLGGRHGAHPDEVVVPIDLEWLGALPDGVALVTLGPELAGAAEAIRLLRERGVRVAIGHTAASPAELAAAVDAGASLFTHLFNASGPVEARAPGPVGAALTEDRLAVSLIADGVHVDVANLRLAFAAKPPGTVVLVTDAVAWPPERVDDVPRLPDGTIAGSVLTMDAAVRRVVDECGVDLATAVDAASGAPARVLGLTDRGVLRPGAVADVVALDQHLEVQQVWVGGAPALD